MRNYETRKYKRINKTTARKLYNNDFSVLFIPCNLNPESPCGLSILENKDLNGQYDCFDELCKWFTWYNCTTETGKYIAFYLEK